MIRGELWWVDYGSPYGSEPGYRRPVIIISQIGVIDKERLIERISKINYKIMEKIENNILFILGMKMV
jgi:mRNA interferase MazF